MSTTPRSRFTKFLALPSLAALSLALTIALGCGADLTTDPLFADQQTKVEQLNEESRVIGMQIRDLNQRLSTLDGRVKNVRRAPEVGNERVRQLERRIQNLEKAVADTSRMVGELQTTLKKQQREGARFASTRTSPRQSGSATTAATLPRTSNKTVSRPAAPSPAPRTSPSGYYYVVKRGEGLISIAESRGLTESRLRTANNIPSGREPMAGQQIYIPATL